MELRDLVLGAQPPTERVRLPELGDVTMLMRGMTGVERDVFEASCWEGRGKARAFVTRGLRAKLVASCAVDDQGHRLFTDADVEALGQVRADMLDRLFGVAQRLSGMSDRDLDDLGLALPSRLASAVSSSDSPATSG